MDSDSPGTDESLRSLISARGLTGDPSAGRNLSDIGDPLPQLGMKLFFTKSLGGDFDAACVSCHHPSLGGGDALSLSIGVGADDPDLLGPGRTHAQGPLVPRNAPTTFNMACWDSVLFWDGRVESLGKTSGANGDDGQGIRTPDSPHGTADPLAGDNLPTAQSRFPVTSDAEMRGFSFEHGNDNETVRSHLAARIGNYVPGDGELATNDWLPEFQAALNNTAPASQLITYENIARAIGEYERSQLFIDNPWKEYCEGENGAISASAKRGGLLFFRGAAEGGAGCADCHAGDLFSDEDFHVMATPQVGLGKGDGATGDDDFGRFRETGAYEDLYAFRTPSLLNVEVTGPYGHAGAYTTLEGMVRHMLNPSAAFETYDYGQLDPSVLTANTGANTRYALAQLEANRVLGISPHRDTELMEAQVNDLVSFLLTLTDPCVTDRSCLAPWIPDCAVTDPDGNCLSAVDGSGTPL
jgi:cytochrome c peroxidase